MEEKKKKKVYEPETDWQPHKLTHQVDALLKKFLENKVTFILENNARKHEEGGWHQKSIMQFYGAGAQSESKSWPLL